MKNLISALIILISASVANAELPLEPLYGYFKSSEGVAIQVFSGGCTNKESFQVQKVYNNGINEISFVRVKPDYCEAFFKYGRMVLFSYEDLGLEVGDAYELMNPKISVHVVR